jgi:hypothetical protein
LDPGVKKAPESATLDVAETGAGDFTLQVEDFSEILPGFFFRQPQIPH